MTLPNVPMKALIQGGRSQRWHTELVSSQNIAEHSWGVAMLITLLWPEPSANLLKAALTHDFAEHATVDLPAPFKWKHPTISMTVNQAEQVALTSWGLDFKLTPEEQAFLRVCDLLEAYVYLCYDITRGNAFAQEPFKRVYVKLHSPGTWADPDMGDMSVVERWPAVYNLVCSMDQLLQDYGVIVVEEGAHFEVGR